MTGDGQPDIGVAGANFYVVYGGDGKVKWQRPTQDLSSGQTGSTVFDFDGDTPLANTILVDGKILAADIWKKITIRVLDLKLQGDCAGQRSKFDFGLGSAGLAAIERIRGSVRNSDRS